MTDPSKFDLLQYLSSASRETDENSKPIPSLKELGAENHVSIAKLREQLSVARSFGFVDVRPNRGITLLPYTFSPAVRRSLSFAVSVNREYFDDFSDLRKKIEADYWFEAVQKLTPEDIGELEKLVGSACNKLAQSPPRLPHKEHRDLHLKIYGKLENVFVVGLLEAYWDAYEAVGINRYTELSHWKEVWEYHARIVEALKKEALEDGYNLLLEHMTLLKPVPVSQDRVQVDD